MNARAHALVIALTGGVAAGKTMSDPEIVAMDWHVKGVVTPLPK